VRHAPLAALCKGSHQGGTIKGNVSAPRSTGSWHLAQLSKVQTKKGSEPVECGVETLPFIVPPW